MQYQSFLIKYAEIGTKGKNRYMFEDALIKQIRYALKSVMQEWLLRTEVLVLKKYLEDKEEICQL